MSRKVYLQGGPKDGEYVTIGDDWSEVVCAEPPPVHLIEPLGAPPVSFRRWCYRPQGRRTLQGIEVFECD